MIEDNKSKDSVFSQSEIQRMYDGSEGYSSLADYISRAVSGWADSLHGDVVILDEDGVEWKRFRGGMKSFKQIDYINRKRKS